MSLNIVMIGSGYVGLVSGACLAGFGHDVVCVDVDESKIELLNLGEIPIYEPGLQQLVEDNTQAGRLRFSTDVDAAVSRAEVVFIAVGTPSRRGDGHADLSYVYAAARSIAKTLRDHTVVVTKSTVPVGTGDEVERIIRDSNPQVQFSVVSNPEFLREGAAISDFQRPDRVVIGSNENRATRVMEDVYRPLSLNSAPIMTTDRRTAELIKYAGNAFLAMKITFINEIADLCEKTGTDVQAVARGIGLDNRIGSKFLNAGPGYGGSCFPKDTLALIKTGRDYESPLRLVETTVAVNDQRKRSMAMRILNALGGDVHEKIIAFLGLTFKPETDDMRDAPSIPVIQELQKAGARIKAYDPAGIPQAQLIFDGVEYSSDPYSLAEDADCVVLITEWNEFRMLDLDRIKTLMTGNTLVDLRNVYRRSEVESAGLRYFSIGRGQEVKSALWGVRN